MTIKEYVGNHNFLLINESLKGINYEFNNIRKSNQSYSNEYIIFDEKFVLKKIRDNVYKLLDFCRLEEFSEKIDKVVDMFYYDFFKVEMVDKNDEIYIVQFISNAYGAKGKSTLKVYKKTDNYMLSNPYGPALVVFDNHKIVKSEFYFLDKKLNEFEIEVLKATQT